MGLLEPIATVTPTNWADLARAAVSAKLGSTVPKDAASLRSAITDLTGSVNMHETFDALAFFGIIPGHAAPLSAALPKTPTAPIDLFAAVLADKLRYAPGERDLVLLYHEVVARAAGGAGKEELHTSSLVAYGDDRASAMARCVGLPLAFAVRSVLDGGVIARGVCGPGADRAVWGSVLSELQRVGLGMRERIVPLSGNRLSLEESLMWARK